MCLKTAGRVAKNDDPDQTPRYAASDLGLRCLPGRPSRYLRVITGTCRNTKGTHQIGPMCRLIWPVAVLIYPRRYIFSC